MMKGESVRILLVEDNQAHAELVMRSFEDKHVTNQIYHVTNGEVALDFLFHTGEYADLSTSPRPHLILLDLRLPRIDGLEVARRIKSNSDLQAIPIVILTTSKNEQDLDAAYKYHVNSYLTKPIDFNEFMQLLNDLGFYWLIWNIRPRD